MKTKVAFVVDALAGMGGGERVVCHALELFPDAPVYTLFYNPTAFVNTRIAEHPVISAFTNHLPLSQTHYRSYLPLMMLAIKQIDLSQFDLVVSFSYAVAHAVRTRPGQRHLSYTYTPMRYAWRNFPVHGLPAPTSRITRGFFNYFRKWDTRAAAQVDQFAAVSRDIAGWIKQVYQRDSVIIYPPVEVQRFQPHHPRDQFFITVSRLVAHKRLDLIVETFSTLKLPLVVVGEGPELAHLRRSASPEITFLGHQPDEVVADLLGRARAYVSAAEEDFGIAMVEAQAAGCPVISYQKGGALETVVEGRTGVFFKEQTVDSLCDSLERFTRMQDAFSENNLVTNARQFDPHRFKVEFSRFAGLPGAD
jgi:glycosyltransferase involved in cell wall biosynthesis